MDTSPRRTLECDLEGVCLWEFNCTGIQVLLLTVLHFLAISWGFLESPDDQWRGTWHHRNLSLSVLDSQLNSDTQSFPLLCCLGNVISNFFGRLKWLISWTKWDFLCQATFLRAPKLIQVLAIPSNFLDQSIPNKLLASLWRLSAWMSCGRSVFFKAFTENTPSGVYMYVGRLQYAIACSLCYRCSWQEPCLRSGAIH